jgi:hypothetical protein
LQPKLAAIPVKAQGQAGKTASETRENLFLKDWKYGGLPVEKPENSASRESWPGGTGFF